MKLSAMKIGQVNKIKVKASIEDVVKEMETRQATKEFSKPSDELKKFMGFFSKKMKEMGFESGGITKESDVLKFMHSNKQLWQ
jgi:hypothetical protein